MIVAELYALNKVQLFYSDLFHLTVEWCSFHYSNQRFQCSRSKPISAEFSNLVKLKASIWKCGLFVNDSKSVQLKTFVSAEKWEKGATLYRSRLQKEVLNKAVQLFLKSQLCLLVLNVLKDNFLSNDYRRSTHVLFSHGFIRKAGTW